jgi:hypothetical protein
MNTVMTMIIHGVEKGIVYSGNVFILEDVRGAYHFELMSDE